ncbi:MAG: universal stress protein [Chloroflexota bacterium]|nr:MAG: universal stress protein [Chloroflexota bacterium]
MTTILVPLDGSDLSERAIPYAVRLARATHGGLLFVRAALAYVYESEGVTDVVRIDHHAAPELEEVAVRARAMGVPVETHVAHGVSAADSIVATARERNADLIVMSTHGRGGVGRFIYGSVADQVLRHGGVPMLLVTPGCDVTWPDRPLKALVPLDGSATAMQAIATVTGFAHVLPVEVVLLRVIEPPQAPPMLGVPPTYSVPIALDTDEQIAQARSHLEDEASRLGPGIPIASIRAEIGATASTIIRVAAEEAADLIVMSTHGRGGLTRLVMGSVATATLQRTPVPILLIPAGARARPALHLSVATLAEYPTGPSATVSLTPSEVALVEYGLELLLYGEQDRRIMEPIQAIIGKVRAAAQLPDIPAGAAVTPGESLRR